MSDTYPLVEAIFELRWGEKSPRKFNISPDESSVFFQKLAMSANENGYSVVETPNGDIPPIPTIVKYRYRKAENEWPCLQAGVGIFTVNQTLNGYKRDCFLSDIEKGILMWKNSLSETIESILPSLKVLLRYRNAFYDLEDSSGIKRIEERFGINVTLPDKFESNLGPVSNMDIRFTVDCLYPINSKAVIVINDAVVEGRPGILVDTCIEAKYEDIIDNKNNIQEQAIKWLEQAYTFQKKNFEILMG